MKYLALALLALTVTAGCHSSAGQLPPATPPPAVSLSWSAPVPNASSGGSFSGCTTSQPCTYSVYRDSSGTCDVATSANWKRIDDTASGVTATTPGVSSLTFLDSSPSSGSDCYAVYTIWQGANSAPSNTASVSVPTVGIPTAPGLNPPTATAGVELPKASPNGPVKVLLVARLERR